MSTATVPAARTPRRRFPISSNQLPVVGTFVVLALMLLLGGVRYDNFLTPRTLANLLINKSFLIALAVGMTFVILMGGIDLSVGAVLALGAIVTAATLRDGWPIWLVLPLAILSGTLIGLLHGLFIHYFKIQPFIATLAGMFLARGLCFVIAPASIAIDNPSFVALSGINVAFGESGFRLTGAVIIALVLLLVAFFVLHYTRLGRTVYAIGGGEQSALMMGLPVARSKVLAYVISGTCAGIGGVLFAMFSRSGYALTGVGMELDAIAAVVIGGTLLLGGRGYVLGSFIGVLVLGLIQTIITYEGTLSSWWTKIVIGALLLVFVVLQRALTRHNER